MTHRRSVGRTRVVSRSLLTSVCVAAALIGGAAFAQQAAPSGSASPKAASFVRPSVADSDSDSQVAAKAASSAKKTEKKTAASAKSTAKSTSAKSAKTAKKTAVKSASSEQPVGATGAIRQVGAAYPAKKARPIRQAQYAQAETAPATTQLNDNLGATDAPYVDACPDPRDMPSILDVPYKIIPKPGLFPENCPLPDEDYQRKAPTPITFTWKASSLCYKPLYFEDVQLERYGHYCHPLAQPFVSRVRFLLTIPVLPYLMGVNPPCECVYDLGYYRPGNCAPSMLQPIPISLRGGLIEAGAVVGVAAIVP